MRVDSLGITTQIALTWFQIFFSEEKYTDVILTANRVPDEIASWSSRKQRKSGVILSDAKNPCILLERTPKALKKGEIHLAPESPTD